MSTTSTRNKSTSKGTVCFDADGKRYFYTDNPVIREKAKAFSDPSYREKEFVRMIPIEEYEQTQRV